MKARKPMQIGKRWMAMLLACAMIFTLCPTAVFADDIRTDIVVSNIQLSTNTVALTGINDEQDITITADVEVPTDFDGGKPFYFWFQEQVPEEQCRGYDEVYATQDAATGKWTISGDIKVTTWWPEGEYKLSYVTYENHDQRVSFTGDVSLMIDRSAVSDNEDPVATGISIYYNDSQISADDTLIWEDGGTLQVCVAVTDANDLTEQGNMVLRSETTGARYEHSTDYVYTEIKDDGGNVTGYTREMVLTVDLGDLEPGKWYIEHFTVDDVYGNYVFYNYNGSDTDGDGTDNGNDDLLDDATFMIESDAMTVFFINEDDRWDAGNGFFVELEDENGNLLTEKTLKQLEGGINGWVWYAWIDAASWNSKYSVTVYNGNDSSASESITTVEMTGTVDTLVLSVDEEGNIIAGLDTFDPDKYMDGQGSGNSGHEVRIHFKDDCGNIFHDSSYNTPNSGTIDLSDEGITLDFEVPDFVFPGDAGALEGTALEFVGWWVKETGQLITAESSDEIATDSYEINLYPQYEKAPVRIQAHYVNTDGDLRVETQWFSEDYNTTIGSVASKFDKDSLSHIGSRTHEGWYCPYADTDLLTPDIEGVVHVAEYDQLYFTINYEYLVDVDIDGRMRADWHGGEVTVFVPDATYTDQKVADYFANHVAPGLTHSAEVPAVTWDYEGWTPDNEEIGFGNCYGIKANYGVTRLYFVNTDSLWDTENGLFAQLLDENDNVITGGSMLPVVGSREDYCWYTWVDNTSWESKAKVKVYAGEDANAASWTKPVELPGDTDTVVLVVNDAPASGEFEAGNDHFRPDGWYMDNGEDGEGGEGGEGEEMPSGHKLIFHAANESGMEIIMELITDDETVSFSTEFGKLSAEDQARLTISQYTFPEWANNGLANTTLAFEGWYVMETGDLITAANDLIMNVEEYEINLVAQYEKVPVCMVAGYVNDQGNYQVYDQWYAVEHGTTLSSVVTPFLDTINGFNHTGEHEFLEWNMLNDWDMDGNIHAAVSGVEYVAVYEEKYVTINYNYLTDVEENGDTVTVEAGGSKTIFVEERFTDLDVADYFHTYIANNLEMPHTGGKTPDWKYDHWLPSPQVSGNANCYGIYAEYPVEMTQENVTAVTNEIQSADQGSSVYVDMNTYTEDENGEQVVDQTATIIPAAILEAAASKNVDVVFDMGGYSWTVSGGSIEAAAEPVNLKVNLEGDALHHLDEAFDHKQQLSIAHDGDFGFAATLEIPVQQGLPEDITHAILLYYVAALGRLMPMASCPIVEGKVSFDFTHASDYLVVYGNMDVYPVAGADLNGDGEFVEGEIFSTLAEAIAAANAITGREEPVWVYLGGDTVETETMVITGNIALELDRYDVAALPGSGADEILFHVTTGQLTVDAITEIPSSGEWDGREGTRVTANGELFRVGLEDSSKDDAVALTINGGLYESSGNSCIVIYDGITTLNVDNQGMYSTFKSDSESHAAIRGSEEQYGDLTVNGADIWSEYREAIYWPQNGALTVTDGGITGGTSAVYAKQGTVNISGGVFYGYGEKVEYDPTNNSSYGTGDTIVLDNCGYGELTVSISGGYFYSSNGAPVGSYAGEGYSALTEEQYMAETCHIDGDGNVEARASDVETLIKAIAVSSESDTVVRLYANIELAEPLIITGCVTLDLAGCTLSAASDQVQAYSMITNQGDLTIGDSSEEQSGMISFSYTAATGSTGYYVNTITNCGMLTITGGTVRNTSNVTGQIGYAIDNNSTTADVSLSIDGGAVIAEGSNYYDGVRQFANSEEWYNDVSVYGGSVSSIWQQNPSDDTDKNTKDSWAGLYIWDGTVNAVYFEPNSNATLEIHGGTIGSITTHDADTETNTQRIPSHFIYGGTFKSAPAGSFINKAYALEENEDGSYGIIDTPAVFCMYSISLGEDIGLNLYMSLSEELLADETAYMQFTSAKGTEKISIKDVVNRTYMDEEYESFTYHVVAAAMDMDVKAQMFYAGGYTAEITCSVQSYLNYQKELAQNGEIQDEKLMEAVYATEIYGRHADLYFNGNDGSGEIQEDPDLAWVTAEELETYKKSAQGDDAVKLSAVSLLLKDKTILRLFFSVDAAVLDSFAVTYAGEPLTHKERGGLWYVDITGIAAKELDADVTVTVTYGTGDGQVSFDVVYCPLAYCYNVLSAESGVHPTALINVVRSLYQYNQTAKAYLAPEGEE